MRAQAHTLEAFVAALLVLGGVVFAIQATAVTPLSASTSNQHIENQQRAQAAGVLAVSHANDTLHYAVTATANDTYRNGGPPNPFGRALDRRFGDSRIAFNVHVVTPDRRWTVVNQGDPTDNAVSVSHSAIIYDDTPFPGPHENVSAAAAANDFGIDDQSPNTELYAVTEVRVVLWRI